MAVEQTLLVNQWIGANANDQRKTIVFNPNSSHVQEAKSKLT